MPRILFWSIPSFCCIVWVFFPEVFFNGVPIDKNTKATTTPAVGKNHQSVQRLLSSITTEDLNHCIQSLEDVAKDGVVGMDEFIQFLEDFSGRTLAFENFEDIPATLVMIYYTAACTLNDDGCDTDDREPSMYIEDIRNAAGVLNLFCQSVKDVGAIQISANFQFQIEFNDDDAASQKILSWSSSTDIIRNLELATEESLLNRFGCSSNNSDVRRRVSENLATVLMDESLNGVLKQHQNQRLQEQLGIEEDVALNTSGSCDYKVHSRISNLIESACLPNSQTRSDNRKCVVATATVSVTAASLYRHRSSSELRGDVMTVLKSMFTQNGLKPFLP